MINNIVLMYQIIDSMAQYASDMEKAVSLSDKEKFDKSKKSIVEAQSKIDNLIAQLSA